MSAEQVITAYSNVAFPEKQKQERPGLDRDLKPGVEYTKLEGWDDNGKPFLYEYEGSGKLKNKTAIVTGGDSGIGRSAAIMFAREGMSGITITYLEQETPDAQDAKAQIEAAGAKCNLVCVDLVIEANCKKVVESHIEKFGKLNVLVNNASTQSFCKDLSDIDLRSVETTFRSNILQMIAVTKFALPHLKRGSSIINTASITAFKGSAALIDYSSTKGAIVSFTKALAAQLLPQAIRVNAVAPGPVMTALQAASRSAESMEGWGVGTPLHGRAGQPAELGPTYVYLASSDSNIVTGEVLHVNSGKRVS